MQFQRLSASVGDVVSNGNALCFAQKATGGGLAYFFCDWETMQTRQTSQTVFLQHKFGARFQWIADALGAIHACRSAVLPDGGCAALQSDGELRLFRPDGRFARAASLRYHDAPAYDIVCDGSDLWFSVPLQNALVRYSLQDHVWNLRAGGKESFSRPMGLTFAGHGDVLVTCNASRQLKPFDLLNLQAGASVCDLPPAPEKAFLLFGRLFVWAEQSLFVAVEPKPTTQPREPLYV